VGGRPADDGAATGVIQTSDTIDKNNTMGRAQNRTSAWVSDQPRRLGPAAGEFRCMSRLLLWTTPCEGRLGPQSVIHSSRRRTAPTSTAAGSTGTRGHLSCQPVGWGDSAERPCRRKTSYARGVPKTLNGPKKWPPGKMLKKLDFFNVFGDPKTSLPAGGGAIRSSALVASDQGWSDSLQRDPPVGGDFWASPDGDLSARAV